MIRMCQKRVIHSDELWDAADTAGWAFDAVIQIRARDLASMLSMFLH